MENGLHVSVAAVTVLLFGCGGQSADDIARGIDDAVRGVKPKPGISLPRPAPVLEESTESAARRAVCGALGAYSSDPSQAVSDYIADYAERQRVLATLNLNEIDPDAADSLADAASEINDTQEAAEVADELAC